ncbi:MAG TPA: PDR/VanB family oxidoreductase [Bradyrhizobium sp.]|nr:PDR/VanB family oxidoreductase [Bradyrhizobium sp.]
MTLLSAIPVRIVAVDPLTPGVKRFTLAHADGKPLPHFSSGSHILLSMRIDGRVVKNAYSLVGAPGERSHYQIAVRRLTESRGGSAFLHEVVEAGHEIEIDPPANLFPLVATARKHLLIAGGIGITPFLSHLVDLQQMKARFELHYGIRSETEGPFAGELLKRHPGHVTVYADDLGQRIAPLVLLAQQPLGTHVYVCGPPGMIAATVDAAEALGWPARYVHVERFAAAQPGRPFTAVLARSGKTVDVPGDRSLLDTLEEAGCAPPSLCRGGACGFCETGVIEGEVEHRDFFLSPEVKATHRKIMACVSRARHDRLVLDL